MLWCEHGAFFSDDVTLVLPGPLALGAAGLAFRVMNRIWPDLTVITAHRTMSSVMSVAIEYGHVPRSVLDRISKENDHALTFGEEHRSVQPEHKPTVDHHVPGLGAGDPLVALDICLRDLDPR